MVKSLENGISCEQDVDVNLLDKKQTTKTTKLIIKSSGIRIFVSIIGV